MTDEASGIRYVLDRGEGGFSAYEGQRVTIEGTAQDTGASYKNLDVSDIRAAQGEVTTVPSPSADPTVSFKLETDCKPPTGTTFFGGASQQAVGLTDPDGDGTYTGSLTLPEGFYDLGAFALPVSIQAGTPEDPTQQIKNFGEVVLEDGDAFSASASFCGGDSGSGNTGGGAGTTSGMVETTGPAAGRDEDGGNVETASIDLNEDGAVSKADDDFAAETSEQGVTNTPGKGALPGAGVLPSTGGLVLPVAGAVGALLLAGGLLYRRISR